MFQLRYATLQDATALTSIAADTFYHTYAAFNTPENMELYMHQYFSVEYIRTELQDKNATILLAMGNDEIAGYAKVAWGNRFNAVADGKALEIARLYAATNHIGKGVGKFLIQHCIEFAREGSANRIWLGVWEQNKKAISFYERFGFERISVCTFLLGADEQQDYIMEKTL